MFVLKSWHIGCQYVLVIKNIIMRINMNSLCRTCIHTTNCVLTSNKNSIWSCSEYEERLLKNTDLKPILISDFNFSKSEKEIERSLSLSN
jgi:hypothetical protein